MSENGQVDQMENVEVIPDFENEQIESMPETPKKGCGCNKNKGVGEQNAPENPRPVNWLKISMVVGGILLAYYLYKNSKGKVSTPKVEVPEV